MITLLYEIAYLTYEAGWYYVAFKKLEFMASTWSSILQNGSVRSNK